MKILKIEVEIVEGQKVKLTGEQLENQPGLKRDVIDTLAKMDSAKCLIQKPTLGVDKPEAQYKPQAEKIS